MRKMTEKEKLSWDARKVGEFGTNKDGSPRPSLAEVTKARHEAEKKRKDLIKYRKTLRRLVD